MPSRPRLGLLVLASLALLGFLPSTCGLFAARLSGDQEVPPVVTRANGEARFLFTDEPDIGLGRFPEKVIHYRLAARGLARVTQAHVHCGPEGTNGPVAVLLYGLDPHGTTLTGIHVAGTITEADLQRLEDSQECPGGIQRVADLAVKMKTGGAYVNVHSEAHPDGEIRGRIVEALGGLREPIPCGPRLRCNPRTEICVQREPVGPAIVFDCEPVPAGCRSDRTCACAGASICSGAFDVCHDVPELDTISCECPECQ